MSWCVFPSLSDLGWLHAGVTTRDGESAPFVEHAAWIRAVASGCQVHGAGVMRADDPPNGGEGAAATATRPDSGGPPIPATITSWRFGETDALMTSSPGIALAVSVADCVPVVIVDGEHRAIGVAHAGWRGLAAGVVTSLIEAMSAAYGTRAATCRAALGPAVGPCCYTVGPDVAVEMARGGRSPAFVEADPGLPHASSLRRLDLWKTGEAELVSLGVPAGAVESLRMCTSCHPELFHSRRRDGGIRGRMWGFALIVERGGTERGS